MTLTHENLRQFIGTNQYHTVTLGLKATDGVAHVAKEGKAFWLMDLISSYQPQLKEQHFQLWTLKKTDNLKKDSAVVTCEDGDGKLLKKQEIGYSDFPLDEIRIYCIDGVLLLPSEY